ncbi:Maf family protein [Neptuniibacter sp. QD34_54]|uniref:Maf family protein n=1 Tax=Neptuniibacter sp. QD34_54 TaxID=3398208 RepID=UPI0039F6280B
MELILASASPRRKALLDQIGVQCSVKPVDICEDVRDAELAMDYVERLAIEKAQVCFDLTDGSKAVLGSDTTVVLDGRIMGKPADQNEAIETLQRLSGNTHQVLTAVAVVTAEQTRSVVVTTDVSFRPISLAECEAYWRSGEPQDKAGSYGIQGFGAVFVEEIKGSYSAVVGLPLTETAEMLVQAGIRIWHSQEN